MDGSTWAAAAVVAVIFDVADVVEVIVARSKRRMNGKIIACFMAGLAHAT